MATNLIANGNFSDGDLHWTKGYWYAGNTVTWRSSGGQEGGCMELSVPSVGDPGQSSIAQNVLLQGGTTYTLTFYAKRTGNVDVWVEVYTPSGTLFSSSFIPNLTSGGTYTKLSYTFTAGGTTGQSVNTGIRLIAGSAGGTAWFDTVEILGDREFMSNRYVETVGNARIYKTPDPTSEDNYGAFPDGAKFVYDAIVDGMVAVAFGKDDGTTINAYIPRSKCQSSNVYLEEAAEWRMATIASSLVGVYGTQLGLDGNYCESFVHWLAGASNLSHNVFCGSAYCGPAVKHYDDAGLYDVRSSSSGLLMQCGDIAYYDVSGYGTDNVSAAHAGYVIATSGDKYTAIEGNAGEAAPYNQQRVAVVIGDRFDGTNTTHDRILHGVGRPFGRG